MKNTTIADYNNSTAAAKYVRPVGEIDTQLSNSVILYVLVNGVTEREGERGAEESNRGSPD